MTVEEWLRWTTAEADRRSLPALTRLLDSCARLLETLRAADFNDRADAEPQAQRSYPSSEIHAVARTAASDSSLREVRLKPDTMSAPATGRDASFTIHSFAAEYRRGEINSREITERCLTRIDTEDRRLNAFILVLADDARAQSLAKDDELARGIDRGPLHGVPISIKDLLDLRGTPTTAASRVREGHVARRDADIVARLREAGAVFIGKTNLHEFALGTTNEDSAFGPARHPRDFTRSPGGSSGGSAVSVAAGMALASIGTDTGGSIRIPAAACGIVGLKPRFGELSTSGVVPLSGSLDHVGPLAGSVGDAWLVYRALLGDHHADVLNASPSATAQRIRVGVLRRYFCELLDDDVRARFDESLARLSEGGVRIEDVEIPHAADIAAVYTTIVLSEAAACHAASLEAMPERYSETVRMRLEMGRFLLAEDLARAFKGREILRQEVEAPLAAVEALVLPTLPIPAPELGTQAVRIGSTTEPLRGLMLRNTQIFNLSGHPAISLPCGTTSLGLPCGIQLVGRQTEALCRTAAAIETLLSSHES